MAGVKPDGGAQVEREGQIESLLSKAGALAARLDKGRAAIQTAQANDSERADFYFEHWMAILLDYEQTVDQLRRLGVSDEDLTRATEAGLQPEGGEG